MPPSGADEVAGALRTSIGLLVRRLRLQKADGDLTLPETAALSRLDRGGPMTAAALAKVEQISPQSMGATLARLDAKGLIARRPDAADGRKVVLSLTPAGAAALRSRRRAGTETLAAALATGFTPAELRLLHDAAPLIERLADAL